MPRKRLAFSIASAVVLVLVIAIYFFVHSGSPSSSEVASDAVAYVLKVEGKWQRQAGSDLKPGEELRVGDSLSPEHADKQTVLTIYEFGKGPKTISGERGTYQMVRPSDATQNSTDWLTMFLPRVKDVFPEMTISRGDDTEPMPGPLLVSANGVDLAPLRMGTSGENSRPRRVRLRFVRIAIERPAGTNPTSNATESKEFPYVWNPAKLGMVADARDLRPGLYRLQVWAAPPKGSSLPPLDSDAFPDRELVVVLVRGQREYQEARRDYASLVQHMDRDWDKNLPADVRASIVKACLLRIAEQYENNTPKN